ncbi:hypothetical protein [Acetilactobacillus jinshanensis]|uniref:Uncharacterized protein n=1 Tax=Acetilactobacillus jinshanensis TaxID=1720083 RepID=A0A4P6ZKE7_9LACO|nr:hypothetical protein [Acetilactobacillus jinshanensis]QBP18154.1 hypothetical protein ELX58_03155 [Acetilactobacillus jinshanensis]URL61020.1 hypothetical protein HGK75_03210 [uncultured bacterium]
MTKTRFKFCKAIYHIINLMIALAVYYLGSLTLNTDLDTSTDIVKLITFIGIAVMLVLLEGLLSYRLHHIEPKS